MQETTKRVLMGITLSELGGAQKVMYELLAALPADRFEITLACRPGGELLTWVNQLNEQRPAPIRVVELPHLHRAIKPLADLRVLLQLRRLMRREGFDVVHLHSSKMGILGRIAAYSAGVPHILFTVHGWGAARQSSLMQRLLSLVERMVGRLTHSIVCVCEHDRRLGITLGFATPNRTRVIYNGVTPAEQTPGALRRMLGLDASTYLFGTVGRLVEEKQPELVIQTAELLRSRGQRDFHAVLVGDGPLRARCEALIAERGLGDCVTLLGSRDDVQRWVGDLDAFLLPSKYEGFPLVVLEAMQAGLPIIATPVGGVPEQVVDGVTGFLVPSDPSAIVEHLLRLRNDSALRQAMGTAARQRMSLFSVAGMIEAYSQLYLDGFPVVS